MAVRVLPSERYGLLAAAVALAGAYAAAVATGQQIGGLNRGIEALAAQSGTRLGQLADALPFGYAFGVGMVAAVNPCGFALLPAYLAMYVGSGSRVGTRGVGSRALQVLAVSGAMTAGFVLIFGAAGLLLGAASAVITPYLPWLGLTVGVFLVLMGGRMLGGALIYHTLGDRIANFFGATAQQRNPRGYFAYGLAYAAASLSCALPIFLAVVASALSSGGMLSATGQFLLYALGMGFVIMLLTAATAFFQQGIAARARPLARFVDPASAILLLFAGSYVVYYWLTLGGILASIGVATR